MNAFVRYGMECRVVLHMVVILLLTAKTGAAENKVHGPITGSFYVVSNNNYLNGPVGVRLDLQNRAQEAYIVARDFSCYEPFCEVRVWRGEADIRADHITRKLVSPRGLFPVVVAPGDTIRIIFWINEDVRFRHAGEYELECITTVKIVKADDVPLFRQEHKPVSWQGVQITGYVILNMLESNEEEIGRQLIALGEQACNKHLQDPWPMVDAVMGIASVGGDFPAVLNLLKQVVTQAQPKVSNVAARLLAKRFGEDGAEALAELLETVDTKPYLRQTIASVLPRSKSDKVEDLLASLLADTEPMVRLTAWISLSNRDQLRATTLQKMKKLEDDPDQRVKQFVLSHPRQGTVQNEDVHIQVIEALREAISREDPDSKARQALIRALEIEQAKHRGKEE